MKAIPKKNLYRIFILLICGGIVILIYATVTFYVETKIDHALEAIHGKASTIQVNLFSRSVRIQNFELLPGDSTPYSVMLKWLEVRGVSLYQLVINKKIKIQEIHADSGLVQYTRLEKRPKPKSNTGIQDLLVERFFMSNISTEIKTDTVIDFSATINCEAHTIWIKKDSVGELNYSFDFFDGNVKNINISRYSGMYGVSIANFSFNSSDQKAVIDSALLIPNFSKFEFAHRKGEQIARVSVSVSQLTVEGLSLEEMIDSAFNASKVEIKSFDLHSFKDKRVPFLRTRHIPLPMESFSQLPYNVSVDSLIITDSRITIEEFPENGIASGIVTFENVQAVSSWFGNKRHELNPTFVTLQAAGLLMGSGEVNASFLLPLDGSPTYSAKGSISKLPVEKLNPALENLVRLRVTSGQLNKLKFDFQYTDLKSVGTLEIDYENLHMIGLKKKNDDTNEFKTLFINALVRNDKSRELSKLQRTGQIDLERDQRRYIFNVWWKSILDGLKSTVLEGTDKRKKVKTKD